MGFIIGLLILAKVWHVKKRMLGKLFKTTKRDMLPITRVFNFIFMSPAPKSTKKVVKKQGLFGDLKLKRI